MAASQAVMMPAAIETLMSLGNSSALPAVHRPIPAAASPPLCNDGDSRQPSEGSHVAVKRPYLSGGSCAHSPCSPSGESHDANITSCCDNIQKSVPPPPLDTTTCDIVAADEKTIMNGHHMHIALDKKKSINMIAPHPHDDELDFKKNHTTIAAAADHHMTAPRSFFAKPAPVEIENDDNLKVFRAEAGLPKSTFFQATLNCVSLLYGLGILSSPFAVAKAGWMGAIISLLISTTYAYAAYLMAKCLKHNPECATYQDVARVAFGKKIRKLVTALFYLEITGTLVGYCISVGDNLAYIFPHSSFSLPGLSGRNFMIFVASLIMLPSVWLRDLSALSFTSMWCIASTILLLIAVVLAATVNHIGFTHPIPFLRIQGVPVAAGLYAFSYGGTSVFPSICMSMEDPTKFTKVLVVSFVIATSSIAGLGIAGAYMFGDHTASQITLSMPIHFITTKIVLWMTVLTPMFKFALQLSPITAALETRLYRRCKASKSMLYGMSTLMRSMVLALIAIFSMVFPYFEYIVALVGSSMTIAICMILPCVFYLKLYWDQLKMRTIIIILMLVIVGVITGACGTVISVQGLINRRKS